VDPARYEVDHRDPRAPAQAVWDRLDTAERARIVASLPGKIEHAPLPDARELIGRLSAMVDDAVQRAEEESRRAEEESRRAEEESRRAEEESRRADALAERLRALGVDPDA
jgi:hypothetical protein